MKLASISLLLMALSLHDVEGILNRPIKAPFSRLRHSYLSMATSIIPSIRVKNVERTVEFYGNLFGFALQASQPLGESAKTRIGLTPSDGLEISALDTSIQIGDAYSGIGVRMASPESAFQRAKDFGGVVLVELGDYSYAASMIPDEDEMKSFPVRYGKLLDPDGYVVEVIDAKSALPAMAVKKVVVNVLDLDETVAFYTEVLGMKLLRRRSNVYNQPKDASMCAYLGFGTESENIFIELVYNYSTEKLDLGNGFNKIFLTVESVDAAVAAASLKGSKMVVYEASNKKSATLIDPSGYELFIQE